jgi:NhaP-type Na+/H+ or K+/H+ antiporter
VQEQFIMSYGGLRGAVGFSLVKLIDSSVVPSAGLFVTATLAVIMSTVFIQVCEALCLYLGMWHTVFSQFRKL